MDEGGKQSRGKSKKTGKGIKGIKGRQSVSQSMEIVGTTQKKAERN